MSSTNDGLRSIRSSMTRRNERSFGSGQCRGLRRRAGRPDTLSPENPDVWLSVPVVASSGFLGERAGVRGPEHGCAAAPSASPECCGLTSNNLVMTHKVDTESPGCASGQAASVEHQARLSGSPRFHSLPVPDGRCRRRRKKATIPSTSRTLTPTISQLRDDDGCAIASACVTRCSGGSLL